MLAVRRMRQVFLRHHGTRMVFRIQCVHGWLHGGDGTWEWTCVAAAIHFFWNAMIWQRVHSLFCFLWIAGSVNPVLIHTTLTSRIISVSDCKLQSCEYNHEIKHNNGISSRAWIRFASILRNPDCIPYDFPSCRSLAFSMDSRNG